MAKLLKLKAETLEEIEVISSLLQDAAFRVDGMAYLKKEHRFALVANRFRWEKEKKGKHLHQRVRSALRFEGVLTAHIKNIQLEKKDLVVSLLAIEARKKGKNYLFTLIFSGDGAIRLEAEMIEVYLEDRTGAWVTENKPSHPVAGKP